MQEVLSTRATRRARSVRRFSAHKVPCTLSKAPCPRRRAAAGRGAGGVPGGTGGPVGHRPASLVGDAEQQAARCLLATGRTTEARAHADRTMSILAHWPGWRAAQAAALVRRCRRAGRTGKDALAAREREVAALLTEGLTNGEITRRMFISTKTASVHVSNILTDGRAGRTDAAADGVRDADRSGPGTGLAARPRT